ncbi:MAG: hypothetical protein LBI61_00115 [Puniceicoccales bacterium]|jgi:tyrosine-specific transport protein|nr:hypothetical protein [Puniceicoccales bacterium]
MHRRAAAEICLAFAMNVARRFLRCVHVLRGEKFKNGAAVNAHKKHYFWDSVFLIAGMAIGASVLGLPVSLRSCGYWPALAGTLLVYLCTLASGVLLAQLFVANHDSDLPTLFRRHLGRSGAALFNASYFTLAFCLLVAYWSCLNGIFRSGALVVVVVGILLYLGLRHGFELLGEINGALTIVLIFSFAVLTISAFMGERVPAACLANWSELPMGLPIILCSFGYHQVVPIVCERLDYDSGRIKRALIVGTAIPLVFNATILTIGFRLFTALELAEAAKLGIPVFVLLKNRFGSDLFLYAGRLFSFCAIGTSMLGISMAMKGALRDIFKSNKILWQLVEVMIVLPLVPAIFKPQLFFIILDVAGGIFGNLIAGLLPVMPFLFPQRFRLRHLLLWSVFAAIFAVTCIKLL